MKIDQATLNILFNKWEQKYPVENWVFQDIHIWPVLKNSIFFTSFRPAPEKPLKKNIRILTIPKKVWNKCKDSTYLKYKIRTLSLEQSDYIFSAAPHYRVKWKGKQFNRFFDPIIDFLQHSNKRAYLFEYRQIEINSTYKSSRVVNIRQYLPLFKIRDIGLELNLEDLNLFFEEMSEETGLSELHIKKILYHKLRSIKQWALLYEYFIKKAEAKYCFGLCYYDDAMYGMNLAAKKMGIKSIDMQHGLQGFLHPAYFFTKIPDNGYNILPDIFWVWEKSSFDNISKWTKNSPHFAIEGGNPWIDYLEADFKVNKFSESSKPIILFTLQPGKVILPDHVLKVIKITYNKYNWILRPHPRMTTLEVDDIYERLEKKNLHKNVKLRDTTDLPLPLLLSSCKIHISKNSGSIAEASILQKMSIIIDSVGVNSYIDLVKDGKAISCLSTNHQKLIDAIDRILTKGQKNVLRPENLHPIDNYESVIKRFMDSVKGDFHSI